MKLESSDPPRTDEGEPSELGDLVSSARRKGPSDGAIGRMTRTLAAGGALTAATSTAASRAEPFARIGGYKLGALVLVGLASALFVWQTRTTSAPQQQQQQQRVEDAPAMRVETAARVEKAPEPPVASASAPSIPVETLPASAAPVRVAARAPLPVATTRTASPPAAPPAAAPEAAPEAPAPPPASSPEVEFAIIRRAQDALVADPSRALGIVDEHARSFPSGELVQEREVVAVEALARLGRHADAKSRAAALLGRFPRTPYIARLERALGEPVTFPSKTPR